MGFYVRTTLQAGPFRFTLSPAGVGVSVGVPGFRVGTGPRGNYVHVGGLGTTYLHGQTAMPPVPQPFPGGAAGTAGVVMRDLTGAAVQHLAAAHPSELIQQIQNAENRRSVWPWAAAGLLLLLALLPAWGLLLLLPGVPGLWWLWQRDLARRAVVVFYQVDGAAAGRYEGLTGSTGFVSAVQRVWQVEAQGQLTTPYQQKVNAGVAALVTRNSGRIDLSGPAPLITNIAVPSLHGKDRSIYFLPDRALIRHGRQYADLPYSQISAHFSELRFVEDGIVPADSQMVGSTWQFANKSGGPDRRFKNNRQLPIMLYGRVTLTSPQGLMMVWDLSRPDVAHTLAVAVHGMS